MPGKCGVTVEAASESLRYASTTEGFVFNSDGFVFKIDAQQLFRSQLQRESGILKLPPHPSGSPGDGSNSLSS